MKVNKTLLLEKISLASHFTSTKLSSLPVLQGIYIKTEKNKFHIYSSNLNSFFHTSLAAGVEKKENFVIEPKKLLEFLSFLPEVNIDIELKDKQLLIKAGKTTGKFPLMAAQDFPLPPTLEVKEQKIKTEFLKKQLPLVLFSAASDETRPALSGVNFVTNDELVMVATDGFRLSLVKIKKEKQIPSVIIPAEFLKELLSFVKEEKEASFFYSEKEKLVFFKIGETEFYSRLVEGDFPPFEKVVPQEKKTAVKLEKEEFLRNVKLISIFARDFSNIIVLEIKKDGVFFKPKTGEEGGNSAFQEGEIKGEEQRVAFNFRFLLDLLNAVESKNVIVEILRPDAPVVFKIEGDQSFLHIIMPVRIQE